MKYILTVLLTFFITPLAHANEGAGLLYSDLNGAMPKALWRDAPRSEVTYLLENLPATADTRATQIIKKNMLLSAYDTRLVDNDIPPSDENNLLTLRLTKLAEMGLWEEAFTLYTKTTNDPENNDPLAQIGVTLILLHKGLPTACLEEKVIAPRFPDTPFWSLIDNVCDAEISGTPVIGTQLSDSSVLQAIYNEPDFKIRATDITALDNLTMLEMAILVEKGLIDYKGFAVSDALSPYIVKTFLNDVRFPESEKESLEELAQDMAIIPLPPLSEELNANTKRLKNLSQSEILELISAKLRRDQVISKEERNRLADLSDENPENYFFIDILNKLDPRNKSDQVTKEQISLAIDSFAQPVQKKVNFMKSTLDNRAEFSNNLANAYEKQLSLTPEGDYVMSHTVIVEGFDKWLEQTTKYNQSGLSLLIILSNINIDAEEEGALKALKNLRTVGLIDQAHLIARYELAAMMGTN